MCCSTDSSLRGMRKRGKTVAAKRVKKISHAIRYCFNSRSPCQVGGGIESKTSSDPESRTYKEAVPWKLVAEN